MIFDLWPLPKAPGGGGGGGGGGPNICVVACVIHVSNSHTNTG